MMWNLGPGTPIPLWLPKTALLFDASITPPKGGHLDGGLLDSADNATRVAICDVGVKWVRLPLIRWHEILHRLSTAARRLTSMETFLSQK